MGIKYFDKLIDFEMYVKNLPVDKDKLLGEIDHEKAHADVAIKLGYNVQYCVEDKINLNGFRKYRGLVKFTPEITNPKHIEKILSAPKNPSKSDLKKLENLKKC